MLQLCLAILEVWDDIPRARTTRRIPSTPWRCGVVLEVHGLSHSLLTLLHLMVFCVGQNDKINCYLANDDSQQIANSTQTIQFRHAVFTCVKFSVEIDVRFFFSFFFVQYISGSIPLRSGYLNIHTYSRGKGCSMNPNGPVPYVLTTRTAVATFEASHCSDRD